MDILVIGGTGFISGRLVQFLLDEGHSVTTLTRGRSGIPLTQVRTVEHIQADRNVADSMRDAVRGRRFDAVLDMIAYSPEHSQNAVDAFAGITPRFIHCSTVSVYMVSNEVRCPITEDQDQLPLMPPWPRNPFGMDYGVEKRRCEDVLWAAHESGVFSVSMLRPTYVCGPEDKTMRDWFWIQRILDGGPLLVPGSGDHAFQLVYVDDVARAFVDLLNAPEAAGRAYTVAGEDILTLNDYLHRTAVLLGREAELVHVDLDVFDALPISMHPHGDIFPFNTRRTAVFDLSSIKRDVGFTSTPFERWMETTIMWYLQGSTGDSIGYERRAEELRFAQAWQAAKDEIRDHSR